MRFLVTAGNTREMIDQVRDWGNIFTGNTGRLIAQALVERGHVDLLTSNQQHIEELLRHQPSEITPTHFRSHADLRTLLNTLLTTQNYDAIFMTAAVADYSPAGAYSILERKPMDNGCEQWIVADVSAGKVKSHFDSIAFAGKRTEKLVDLFRTRWNYRGLLVKFKLEVGLTEDELIAVAQASRRASDADYIVANTLAMVSGANAGAWLLGAETRERVPRRELPRRLARLI